MQSLEMRSIEHCQEGQKGCTYDLCLVLIVTAALALPLPVAGAARIRLYPESSLVMIYHRNYDTDAYFFLLLLPFPICPPHSPIHPFGLFSLFTYDSY
jgi:hypothetical protein